MKAERRHQLQTNTLAQGIGTLPLFWHKHGTKVLLVLVAALAVVLFVKFQTRNAAQQRAMASESYGAALGAIATLGDPRVGPEQRREIHNQANAAIDQVLENTKDGALKAEAMHARGELNWTLAQSAGDEPPAATNSSTQPSGRAELSKDELLDKAKSAYEAAVATDGAKQVTMTTGRLGLANVAEERRQWDAAKAEYQKIIDDPNANAGFKEHATLRIEDLKRLQNPPLLGKPATLPAPEVETAGPAGPPAPATTRAATATAPTPESAKPPAADLEKPDVPAPAPAPSPTPEPAPAPKP